VVIEEFKQRYLNQPYGDAMLLLRPLAFQSHPYQWPTIGRDISHIERAELGEVKDFFKAHYAPNNAILVLGGKIGQEKGIRLIKKWFDDIPPAVISPRDLEPEPGQQESRNLRVTRDVPYDAIYKAYHMPGRAAEGFHTCDLISDILANGKSSRLYQSLVKEKRIFSDINAYVSGEIDPGLFIVSGKIMAGNSLQDADESIQEILNMISRNVVGEKELQKVKNKVESALVFSESNVLARSINLALYELLGDAEKINVEMGEYNRVDRAMIGSWAAKLFRPENTSTLYYQSTEQKSS
jgi:predicted Zn-dependent peptidase